MINGEVENWFNNLEIGDNVAIRYTDYGETIYEIAAITKITKTKQIELDGNPNKYKDCILREYGRTKTIIPITQNVLDYVERKKLLTELQYFKLNDLNLDQLRKIKAIVKGE